MPSTSTPSQRLALSDESKPFGFRLLPGKPDLLVRVDVGSAGKSVALFVDGWDSQVPDPSASIDWRVFVSPDDACDVSNEEPVAKGTSHFAVTSNVRGLLFALDGLLARYVYLEGTLTRSTGSAQVNFRLQFTQGVRTEPGITAGPMIG